jgi:hypothetical protein
MSVLSLILASRGAVSWAMACSRFLRLCRSSPSVQATIKQLEALLHQQCEEKMLKPISGTVPGQPDC